MFGLCEVCTMKHALDLSGLQAAFVSFDADIEDTDTMNVVLDALTKVKR